MVEKRDNRDSLRAVAIVSTLKDRESWRRENRLGLSCLYKLISLIYLEIPSVSEFSINLYEVKELKARIQVILQANPN